jgi:DMSO/TMAO reductase YedYZ molybdopterin-dependent catalytic subunit
LHASAQYGAGRTLTTKLGFKGAKHIVAIFVTNDYPGGYWDDQGYNWFSGS